MLAFIPLIVCFIFLYILFPNTSLPCKNSCLLQTTEKNAYIIVTVHSQIKQCFLLSLFRQRPKHTNSAHASKNIKMEKWSFICLSTELNLVRFNVLCQKKKTPESFCKTPLSVCKLPPGSLNTHISRKNHRGHQCPQWQLLPCLQCIDYPGTQEKET